MTLKLESFKINLVSLLLIFNIKELKFGNSYLMFSSISMD